MVENRAVDEIADRTEPDFWSWSLDRYGREGAESACLRLQDGFGLNVNILLWACWCAERYDAAPELAMRKAIDICAQWNREVTAALRGARRYLKTQEQVAGAKALRDDIKTAELAAEKIEQAALENLAHTALTPASDSHAAHVQTRARRNLAAYAALAGAAKRDGFSTSLLHDLIDHIFENGSEDGAGEGLGR